MTSKTLRTTQKAIGLGLMLCGTGLFGASQAFAQAPYAPNSYGYGQIQQTASRAPMAPAEEGDQAEQPPAASTAPATPAPAAGSKNGACPVCKNGNGCKNGCNSCCEEECPEAECDCLMRLFDDDCGKNCFEDNGLTFSGWLSQGVNWNPDRPDNNVNGPVGFLDRANEYQMNQFYLVLERAVDTSSCEWQWGGRMDVLYGTDYYYTMARGLELEQDGTQRWNSDEGPNRTFGPDTGALYGIALPQAYAEIGGNDLSVKVGHFYTIIGYEVVTAPDNFFYSHMYTHMYGEPFTHTGVLGTYNLNDQVTLSAGIHNGWDNFDQVNDNMSFLGGISFTSEDENTSLAFALTSGNERTIGTNVNRENRTMYSIVYTRKFCDDFTYILEHDYGFQDDDAANGNQDSQWYGVAQYLFYDINCNTKAGVRAEWFRDDDGVRVPGGFAANYYEVTTGVNWTFRDCMVLRPELRWDWADSGARPYDDLSDANQFLLATDLIYSF